MIERSQNLDGPWDVPLKEFNNHFLAQVTIWEVIEGKDDKIITQKIIDYGKFDDRKWLGRLTYWSLNKGYVIETEAVKK
jgi:hypothetical protein